MAVTYWGSLASYTASEKARYLPICGNDTFVNIEGCKKFFFTRAQR
jgi:hypothetical protein